MRRRPSVLFRALIGMLAVGLVIGILAIVVVLTPQPSCCVPPTYLTADFMPLRNPTTVAQLDATLTSAPHIQSLLTLTAQAADNTQSPYNPTLYAQRQAELKTYSTDQGSSNYLRFYATETALVSAYQGIPTAVPPTPMATIELCGWEWARRDLPAITNLAQLALSMNGVESFTVRVEAYGENCTGAGGQLRSFSAMTTDFYVTMQAADLNDEEMLGNVTRDVYQALISGVALESLPAPFGYLDMTFKAGQTVKHFRVMFDTIRPLLEQGLGGKALLDAIGG